MIRIILIFLVMLLPFSAYAQESDSAALKIYISDTSYVYQDKSLLALKNLILNDKPQEAVQLAVQLKPKFKDNSDYYVLLYELAIRENNFEAAKSAVQIFEKISNKGYETGLLWGDFYLNQAMASQTEEWREFYLKRAKICYTSAMTLSPARPEAVLAMVKYFIETKNYPDAFEKALEAKELNINYPETYYYLGQIYLINKDYISSLNNFNIYIKKTPYRNYYVHYILGTLYDKLAESNKAREEYLKALEINPDAQALAEFKLEHEEPKLEQL
ncbi:MAG: hypothetical protein PHX18_02215 [Candidatus Gastranaerophilales bacterium]|nr:hypothetical protein [Candidatus Gastranaerophilales bacterium]